MKRTQWTKCLFVLIAAFAIAGCCTTHTAATAPAPERHNPSAQYYPVDMKSCALVAIEKEAPNDVYVDQEFEYTIAVKNLSDEKLANVQLKEHIADHFELIGTEPQHTMAGGFAVWDLGKLAGNETKVVRIRGKATEAVAFKQCATVTYDRYLCHVFNVSQPALALEKQMQAEALVNEIIPVRLVVSNPGTGVAKNVTVVDPLPEGLVAENGMTSLKYDVGDLAEDQSKEMRFNVKATRTGKFDNVATATADGLSAKANAVVVVTEPQLKIVKTATEKQYSGRNITYTIKASNVGSAAAANAVIADPLPAGTTLVSASDGGAQSGNQIVWRLGTLAPNTSKTVTATVKAVGSGTIRNTACVAADNAAQVCDSADTKIFGVSAILLEVVDSVDPLEVGETGKYIITAANQGTAKDTNIAISLELEDNMSYVTSSGPTAAKVQGNKVSFAPLPALEARTKVTWTVSVKAEKTGDVRCKVQLESDQLSRPVMETEATTIY